WGKSIGAAKRAARQRFEVANGVTRLPRVGLSLKLCPSLARRGGCLKLLACILLLLLPSLAGATEYADYVLVDKSEHTLTVMSKGKVLAVFKAGFGVYPDGPKERQGDRKTPEGKYV